MTPEEINKKAKEAFPDGVDNERDTAMLRLGFETAYKEISALPTIKGWVARDKDEEHAALWDSKPTRDTTGEYWAGFGEWNPLPESSFPSLRWEDEPIEVELPIIRK